MKISSFENIKAWSKARALTNDIYLFSNRNEFARDFGLRDQMRRASGSIMHNIAEGFDSGSDPEFIRFLRYAQRSATEVQSQLYIALDQEYLSDAEFAQLKQQTKEIHSMIGGFIRYLNQSD